MRLAIISDIHEDLMSLQKILRRIEKRGCDKLVCLGDICGFDTSFYKYNKNRNASACLNLVREKCEVIIPGNHDLHATGRIPEHAASFTFPSLWYDLDADQRSQISNDEIWLHEDDLEAGFTREDLAFLRSLPEYQVLNTPHLNILFSHYAFPNLSGFTKKFYTGVKDFSEHFDFMNEHKCGISVIGHAHPHGFYVVTPKRYRHFTHRRYKVKHNPVIVGIPPVTRNDRRRAFCIFDTERLLFRIEK